MTEEMRQYLAKYPAEIQALFDRLCTLLPTGAEGRLWARMPSFYQGERFVRFIPFGDHINVEAAALAAHRQELTGYPFTPKGMLQLRIGQAVPEATLQAAFAETLQD